MTLPLDGHTLERVTFGDHGNPEKSQPITSTFGEGNEDNSLNRWDQRQLFLSLIFPLFIEV